MSVTYNGTTITFDDGTIQTTAWVPPVTGSFVDFSGNVYTSPGSYTKPSGLKKIIVTVVGAGGDGGPTPASPTPSVRSSASGGGGGGVVKAIIPAANLPASAVTITVGTAPGGTSSFGTFLTASSGSNGANSTTMQAGGAGGTASNSSSTVLVFSSQGRPGKYYSSMPVGSVPGISTCSGDGGDSLLGLGLGGSGATGASGNGSPGVGYGGGGGGAGYRAPTSTVLPAFTGGSGTNGIVIVEEYY